MLSIETGSKEEERFMETMKERPQGSLLGGCWLLWANPGLFTKANLNLNEDREEISLIREGKASE